MHLFTPTQYDTIIIIDHGARIIVAINCGTGDQTRAHHHRRRRRPYPTRRSRGADSYRRVIESVQHLLEGL